MRNRISQLIESVLKGAKISSDEAKELTAAKGADLMALFSGAAAIRERFRGDSLDLCSIVNAKSGACGEDCAFCAQSSHHRTDAPVYPLISVDEMARAAEGAKKNGAARFCVVTSGRGIDSREDLESIGRGIRKVKEIGLSPCATLGTLTRDQLEYLRDAGLHRYHHNMETSREYFPTVCSTHTFDERLDVLSTAKSLGLSLCSGGILGLGESMEDRVSMALSLRDAGVDSVPINFLMPIAGTPLGNVRPIDPLNALHSIALFRFVLPDKEIRVCAGRGSALRQLHPLIFLAGADGFMIGNYLTRTGLDPKDDLAMIADLGLRVRTLSGSDRGADGRSAG
jgi:biotin synthase